MRLSAVQRWCVVCRATLITDTCHCHHTSRTAIQRHTTVTEVIVLWLKSRWSVLLTAAGLDRGRIVNVILSSLITSIVAYRCLDLNRGYMRNNIVLKLDSLHWFSQRRSPTPHYWWVRTQGLWMTPKFELGWDFCTMHLSFVILCLLVRKFTCWQINKQRIKQT